MKEIVALKDLCRENDIPIESFQAAYKWEDFKKNSDMQKFIEVAPDELSEGLFLQTPQSDPSSKEPIIKVRAASRMTTTSAT